MDIIELRIREILNDAKETLRQKKVTETIVKIKDVLKLDPNNEEAKYVLSKLNAFNYVHISLDKKVIILTYDNNVSIKNIKVYFNGVEIGYLQDDYFEIVIKDNGKVDLQYDYTSIKFNVEKNQSSVLVLKTNEDRQSIYYDIIDSSDTEMALNLTKRLLQEQKYEFVKRVIQQILLSNPRSAEAYFILMLADLKIQSIDQLNKSLILIDNNENYLKSISLANEKFRMILISYLDQIKENIYQEGMKCIMNNQFINAISFFKSISDYKDSLQIISSLEETVN